METLSDWFAWLVMFYGVYIIIGLIAAGAVLSWAIVRITWRLVYGFVRFAAWILD